MSRMTILVLALTLPTAAIAQTPAPAATPPSSTAPPPASAAATGWTREWQVNAAPTFGADRSVAPFPVGDEIIDDSELGAALHFSRTFANRWSVKLSPGVSYSPNQFDAEEPASALSFGAGLTIPVTKALQGPDPLSWILSYGIRADFDEAFEDYVRTDQTFGLGLEFTNVLTTVCDSAAPPVNGSCARRNGWKYTITPALNWVESSDHDRERFNPSLNASMEWPVGEFSALYVDAGVDRRMYERVDAPNGDQLRDMRYRITAGVDLSGWTRHAFKLPEAFSFRLGARWSAVSSNDPARDTDQVYFVPELGWKQRF